MFTTTIDNLNLHNLLTQFQPHTETEIREALRTIEADWAKNGYSIFTEYGELDEETIGALAHAL